MAATLIISPDIDWSTKAQVHLRGRGLQCDVALTGKEGQLKAYQSSYDYFFLDLEVKNNSGIEVCKYLRTAKPMSQIFITVASAKKLEAMLLSEKNLLKMGVKKVIFEATFDSLIDHIQELGKVKGWQDVKESANVHKKEGEADIGDTEFARVKISEVHLDSLAVFDYYLRLRSNRYIKIVHKGEKPTPEQFQHYIQNGVEFIYFKKVDREAFISYQNHLAKDLIKDEQQDKVKVYKMMKSATDKYLDEALTEGLKPSLIEEGQAICQNMYNAARTDPNLRKFLSDFEQFNPAEFSHSFLVSFFSTIICKNLDWVGTKSLNTLALGALFHDIGVLQLPEELREKDYALMTPEEKVLYQQHPLLGVEALRSIPGINTGVLQIVEQHHELVNSAGYPHALSGTKQYPLAKVVALADAFAYYIKETGQTPKNSLRGFLAGFDTLAKYDPELIRNLLKAFS